MVKIALIQQRAGLTWSENVARARQAFLKAARAGANLIAFPELSFTRFYPQVPAGPDVHKMAETIPGPTTDIFCRLARETGVVTVINLFEKAEDKTYDASPVIDADGTILGVTRMVHIMEGPGFHEQGYYSQPESNEFVFQTAVGKVGIAICYDRHFPEYMRGLKLLGAEVVVIPQAGAVDEWPESIFEAEIKVAAFQNGYYAALANRVGQEDFLEFAGESFVVDPDGRVIARGPRAEEAIVYADCHLEKIKTSHASRHFLPDRRPKIYKKFKLDEGDQ